MQKKINKCIWNCRLKMTWMRDRKKRSDRQKLNRMAPTPNCVQFSHLPTVFDTLIHLAFLPFILGHFIPNGPEGNEGRELWNWNPSGLKKCNFPSEARMVIKTPIETYYYWVKSWKAQMKNRPIQKSPKHAKNEPKFIAFLQCVPE